MSERMMTQGDGGVVHPYSPDCRGAGCKPVLNELGHAADCEGCKPSVPTPTDIDPKVAEELSRISDDEVRVTSATGGEKGSKLARFDLIPPRALWQVAELYGVGAMKYAPWNWRKGYDWSLSIAALERHWSLFKQGEWLDPETKMPHLCSVVFHALTLLTFKDEQPEYDDRWRAEK